MSTPECPQKAPYKMTLEAGKSYAWCACGKSGKQPLCDGSHSGSGMAPVVLKAEENRDVWFCGCKQSKKQPWCDGSHSALR